MENLIYQDENATITKREIVCDQKVIYLAAIQAVEIQAIMDTSRLYRILAEELVWGIFCLILWVLLSQLLPSGLLVFVFAGMGYGIWRIMERVYLYALVVHTQKDEETVFSSRQQYYVRKLALILCERLGIELQVSRKAKALK